MEDMNIYIDVGTDTILRFDLSDLNFTGVSEVVFTVKNLLLLTSEPIIERRFDRPKLYEVIITAEESAQLKNGARYDFQKILIDGKRIKISDTGEVKLRRAVGDKID